MRRPFRFLALIGAMTLASAASASNLISLHVASVTGNGVFGVLRAGSPWAPAPAIWPFSTVADDIFQPTFQDWTMNSVWWDQDPSINSAPPTIEIQLDGPVTFNQFIVQADDNDSYLLEYWDGSNWATAWAVPPVYSYGLVARDSGTLPSITTSKLRFSAAGGDNYYAVSEIQGFAAAVPEPASWALMIAGLGLIGAAMRRRAAPPSIKFG